MSLTHDVSAARVRHCDFAILVRRLASLRLLLASLFRELQYCRPGTYQELTDETYL